MKKLLRKMDKQLLILMIIFTILGLVMIFSASSITAVLYNKVSESYFFKKQLLVVLACWLVGFPLVLSIPSKKYRKLAPLGLIGIIAALILLFSYGTITNSAMSWFDIGLFNFQPSEFVKSIMIVFLAVYFEKIIAKRDYDIKKIILPFTIILVAVGLIVVQPDFGTAFITAGIAGLIFIFLPIKNKKVKNMKIIGVITAVVALAIVLFSGNFLNAEQSSRLTYKEPCTRYIEKTGYQVCNGFIAISNGGLFGVGLGNSTQKYLYLPEAHTDFIFPIIIEELGAITGIIIIVLFIWLLSRLLLLAKKASTIRGMIIAYGTFAFILLHLVVNLLGVLALIPLTGVPVPFLSYGGSFYINLMFLLFLNQKIAIETYDDHTNNLIRSL